MKETYYAGAYWGSRPESAEACARRAEKFFHFLSASHPDYARWYEKHSSVERSLQLQFEPTCATFVRFLGQKKYQSGTNGFHFSAWTGHVPVNQEGGMVVLRAGSAAEVVPNSLLLHFPSSGPGMERLLTLPVLTGVVRAMVLAWEPDWAVVTSRDLRETISRHDEAASFVGWLTYISRRWGELPPLPEPLHVQPVEDKGSLLILTPERLTITRPEHVALGQRIQQLLEERGLLKELVPRRPAPAS